MIGNTTSRFAPTSSPATIEGSAIFEARSQKKKASKRVTINKKDKTPAIIVISSDDEMIEETSQRVSQIRQECAQTMRTSLSKTRGSSGMRKVELTQVGSVQCTGLVKNKSSERITCTDQPTRREERGSSFCDILSSAKMRGAADSHSSINLEDDAASSDGACVSISDEFSNGGSHIPANRSSSDDCDDDDHDLE